MSTQTPGPFIKEEFIVDRGEGDHEEAFYRATIVDDVVAALLVALREVASDTDAMVLLNEGIADKVRAAIAKAEGRA